MADQRPDITREIELIALSDAVRRFATDLTRGVGLTDGENELAAACVFAVAALGAREPAAGAQELLGRVHELGQLATLLEVEVLTQGGSADRVLLAWWRQLPWALRATASQVEATLSVIDHGHRRGWLGRREGE